MSVSYVGVDWGTTSFRLWIMDQDGNAIHTTANQSGMSSLNHDQFEPFLESELVKLGVDESAPVIICGMAGAAQGWQDAGYVDTPTLLKDIPLRAAKIPKIKRDVWILPGVAQRQESTPDVMRGEETILLGAKVENGVFCLPGTHSKWVELKNGRLNSFRTYMTGELFATLRQNTILKHSTDAKASPVAKSPAFKSAVETALREPSNILNELFSIRARGLLKIGDFSQQAMLDRLSGLLIGLELSSFRKNFSGSVGLVSSGQISSAYESAFDIANVNYQKFDSMDLAMSGLHFASQHILKTKRN